MNSLNHYANGCVAGWMYEYLCGFQFDENGDLFLAPVPDSRLNYAQLGGKSFLWEYEQP